MYLALHTNDDSFLCNWLHCNTISKQTNTNAIIIFFTIIRTVLLRVITNVKLNSFWGYKDTVLPQLRHSPLCGDLQRINVYPFKITAWRDTILYMAMSLCAVTLRAKTGCGVRFLDKKIITRCHVCHWG